jgi:hypothetical protein
MPTTEDCNQFRILNSGSPDFSKQSATKLYCQHARYSFMSKCITIPLSICFRRLFDDAFSKYLDYIVSDDRMIDEG